MDIKQILRTIAAAAAVVVVSSAAHAQATRTWVSGVGDDANPCSRTAPCKTFAGAISKTAPAGEINVLDPGGFGAVTITKALTIRSDSIEAGVLVSGTNGIVVAAGPSDVVILDGLDIEGLGTGLDGVKITSGKTVYILKCAIRRFTGNAVNMNSSTPGARVFIRDTQINTNGNSGVNPATGGGVTVSGNGVGNIASVLNSVLDSNAAFAVQADGAGNIVGVANSVLNGSTNAINAINGGSIVSFGPSNVVSGGNTTFNSTNAFK